jgi:uroporphyrinogen decarboxylase
MVMTKRERIAAALRGQEVDRVPVSAWMHFPHLDKTPEGQAKAFLSFQREFDWDFMKLMFRSTFLLEDWGCTFGDYHMPLGYWLPVSYAVNSPEDWDRLDVLDPRRGALGEMLTVVRMVRDEIGEDVFKLATVFCPFMVARQLAGDRILADMRENPAALHQGLEAIALTVMRFAEACLEHGADGVFFATQSASFDFMHREEYAEFGHPYNLGVLDALKGTSQFTMLHICGKNILFDDFLDYPVHAFNWDDQTTLPSLAQARAKTAKCLIGGIDKMGVIRTGQPQDVEEEAMNAIRSAGKGNFILGPGCGLPIDVPKKNLSALRRFVEKQ